MAFNTTGVIQSCCTFPNIPNLNLTLHEANSYNATLLSLYWDLQETEFTPTCIATPATAEDALEVVSTLENRNCSFAVRGGGHTPWAGSANIENGVTINLESLNQVELSEDNGTVYVGAGNKWVDVYLALEKYNYTIPGGRAATVGVSGLTLGGGISFLAGQYGFVCDNVKTFTLITGNLTLVNVTSDNFPDLFKALKGGSNNFGVVVGFEMYAVAQNPFWGGSVFYELEATKAAQIEGMVNFTDSFESHKESSLIQIWIYQSSSLGGTIWAIYDDLGPAPENVTAPDKPAYTELLAIPQAPIPNTLRVNTMSNFTSELVIPPGGRNLFATLTFKNDVSVLTTVESIVSKHFNQTNGTAGYPYITFTFQFQPLPILYVYAGLKNGGNVLGLENTTYNNNSILFLLDISWPTEQFDDNMHAIASTIIADLNSTLGPENVDTYVYLNYAALDQDPIQGYGIDNVNFMKETSLIHDSRQIFQKLLSGGFKLGVPHGSNSSLA